MSRHGCALWWRRTLRVAGGKSETLEGFTRGEMIEDQKKELGSFDDILYFSRQTFLLQRTAKKLKSEISLENAVRGATP